jgi:hypothetical protein
MSAFGGSDQRREVGLERGGIPNRLLELGQHPALEQLEARLQRFAHHVASGEHHYIEDVVHDRSRC